MRHEQRRLNSSDAPPPEDAQLTFCVAKTRIADHMATGARLNRDTGRSRSCLASRGGVFKASMTTDDLRRATAEMVVLQRP